MKIKSGSHVYIDWTKINRDPSVFHQPDEIRTDRNQNLYRLAEAGIRSCKLLPSPSMRGCESLIRDFTLQLVTSHSMLSSPSASQKKYSVSRTSVVQQAQLVPSLDSLEPSRDLSRQSRDISIKRTRVSRSFLNRWSSCTAEGKNRFGIY